MKSLMIKGFEITELAEFVRSRLGDRGKEVFAEAASLAEPDKNKRYPLESLTPIMDAFGGQGAIYKEFGKYTARMVATTIKILSLVSNLPVCLIRNANLVWGYYFSQRKWEVTERGKRALIANLLDANMPGFWAEKVAGWIEGSFSLGGFERTRVEILHESPERITFKVSW